MPDAQGVQCFDLRAAHPQRVHVQRRQRGAQLQDRVADFRDGRRHRVQVGGWHAALAGQQAGAAQAGQHALDLGRADRQRAQRDVLQDLDPDAAQPDGQDGAPLGIVRIADEQLDAAPAQRRHQRPLDARRGVVRAGGLHELGEAAAHGRLTAEVQQHAADVALVRDVGRGQLEHHRTIEGARRGHGRVGVGRQQRRHHRNAMARQEGQHFVLGLGPLGAGLWVGVGMGISAGRQPPHAGSGGAIVAGGGRRLGLLFTPALRPPERARQAADGAVQAAGQVRCAGVGDDAAREVVDAGAGVAHQEGRHRRPGQGPRQMPMQLRQALAHLVALGRDLVPRTQQRGEIRLGAQRAHGAFALLRRDRAGQVERVVRGRRIGNGPAQRGRHAIGQRRQCDAAQGRGVGGDLTDAARVGDYAQPTRAQHAGTAGDVGGGQQFFH